MFFARSRIAGSSCSPPEAIHTTYDESVSGWLEDFLATI